MEKIRVAIAGVGNCASSLIQGVTYYRDARAGDDVPGLMHVVLGDYHVSDLEFVAAFDVDASKVGNDLGKAIEGARTTPSSSPRCVTGRDRCCALTNDGRINRVLRASIEESPFEPCDVAQALRDVQAEVLVSYLP